MKSELEQYLPDFLDEGSEHLREMGSSLLTLEESPGDSEAIAKFFRAAHTLKGMAATMEFSSFAAFCHSIEGLLDIFRKGARVPDRKSVDLLFFCLDALESGLAKIRASKEDSDFSALGALLESAAAGKEFALPANRQEKAPSAEISTVRVPIKRMDKLLGLVGEMVTVRIRLRQTAERLRDREFLDALSELDRLGDSIRDEFMHARMIPLDYVFQKFPRMVRDLARQQGKEVELELTGADIELDRTVLDKIDTPLVHMLRNSIDHGIETPADRQAQGKAAAGKISLFASKERDLVTITLQDDGRGVDVAEVRKKIVEKRLKSKSEVDKMPDSDILSILFGSGISTTEQVNSTSGRGVGLGAVKALVESLGGFVRMESQPGKGTRITMRLPLSLAIMKNLFVGVGGEIYALPLSSVQRIVKIEEREVKTMEGEEVLLLDGEEIPLLRLREAFRLPAASKAGTGKGGQVHVVIIEQGISRLGLAVDSVIDQKETIVKPLEGSHALGSLFSGATILGDGKVVLIPDISALMKR